MARISLLFSLTFALAVASAFAHEKPVKAKYSPPCTVEQLKTVPFFEISKMIEFKASSAMKFPELGSIFSVCKGYNSFLSSFSKRGDFAFALSGPASLIWKAKFAAMSHALMAIQMGFGAQGKASISLRKNYDGMIHGFHVIPSKIIEISARHQFKAGAKLSVREQKEFTAVLGSFKKCFNGYIDSAVEIAAKKHVAVGGHFGFGGQLGGLIPGFGGLIPGFGAGGKAEFSASASASGKVDVHGKKKKKAHHQRRSVLASEDGFRSLNRPYLKHLVGLKA
ncbi:PREDICTED: uncharacterized protein LOC104805451 [Tarenaya hassleriana]|uniref:uncharacterized protein LOC104805451 n=1 Tax=Tarenaya hassleriana TaxID=28532 RepID=UPI00053C3A3C|nr:PREDICTED: uncharacterized protein LOC104805451 [Tarenaya hassleriana]